MSAAVDMSVFGSGLVFLGEVYFEFKGGWSFEALRPVVCERCGASRIHAHGSFSRMLLTLRDGRLEEVVLWKPRWLCTGCGRTISSNPPDIIAYRRPCTLVVLAVLWSYLTAEKGALTCLPEELEVAVSVRHLVRILAAACAASLETQQSIREVVLEIHEPRPMESLFRSGLDPPEPLVRRTGQRPCYIQLWQALVLVLAASSHHRVPVARLLAWARRRAEERTRQFLL